MSAAAAVTIMPFDLAGASEAQYRALSEHSNRAKKEVLPDDPPTPLAEHIASWRTIPSFVSVHSWGVWTKEGDRLIASGHANFLNMDENRHICQMGIDVEPEYRRQGIGRQLLRRIADMARREDRRLILADTNGRIPAGEEFLRRLGGERALENHTNQLDLAELDRDLVRGWVAAGPERAPGFTLGLWEGPYPEDTIQAIVDLMAVMNTAPRGSLEVDDFHWTPESLRQREESMRATGTRRWTLYAREAATGRFAGFTEVTWSPNRPEIVSQGGTGVFPEFRNHGLGRWLKGAMLEKILAEQPEARFVRTSNADSNGPMLRINHQLGFKPYFSHCIWQIETERVLAYLAKC